MYVYVNLPKLNERIPKIMGLGTCISGFKYLAHVGYLCVFMLNFRGGYIIYIYLWWGLLFIWMMAWDLGPVALQVRLRQRRPVGSHDLGRPAGRHSARKIGELVEEWFPISIWKTQLSHFEGVSWWHGKTGAQKIWIKLHHLLGCPWKWSQRSLVSWYLSPMYGT